MRSSSDWSISSVRRKTAITGSIRTSTTLRRPKRTCCACRPVWRWCSAPIRRRSPCGRTISITAWSAIVRRGFPRPGTTSTSARTADGCTPGRTLRRMKTRSWCWSAIWTTAKRSACSTCRFSASWAASRSESTRGRGSRLRPILSVTGSLFSGRVSRTARAPGGRACLIR